MQVNQLLYGPNAANPAAAYTGTQAADEAERSRKSAAETGQRDELLISEEAQAANAGNPEPTESTLQDNSSKLTHRLVSAQGQFEVRQVLSDAHKDLMSLRAAAATSKGDDAKLANEYIKKLEKFLRRADRKLDDLGKEDMMKVQQARLERQMQEKRVDEIKAELHRKHSERKARENGYLFEDLNNQILGQIGSANTASDAAVAAQAESIAAAEISAANSGLSGGDVSFGLSSGSPSSADSGAGGNTSSESSASAPA